MRVLSSLSGSVYPPEKHAEITMTFHLMPLWASMGARALGGSWASSSGGGSSPGREGLSPCGAEPAKLLIEQAPLPVEHLLLSQPRTRSFGSVIPGRDPKLAARKNRDEDREEPRKKAEREHRRTAAPSGEDVKGARKHGEAPRDKRPIHGVRVEFDRSQAHRRLDRDSSDFENGVRRDEQYRERQGELRFAKH